MAWELPTTELELGTYNNVVQGNFHAYYALGAISTAELPSNKAALDALLAGLTQKFVPLGDLHADGVTWKWAQKEMNMHQGNVGGTTDFTGLIKSAALTATMLELTDSGELDGPVTILLLPFDMPATASANAPIKLIFLSGVTIVDDGEILGKNEYPVVNMNFSADVDKLNQVLIYHKLTS